MGGQVDHTRASELTIHGFETRDPESGRFVVLFGFLSVVALQMRIVRLRWLLTVAMVCLVVEHEDVFDTHQIRHDTLEHLAFNFSGVQFVAGAALEQRASAGGQIDVLA